jgi:hypothetical protein
MCSPHGPESETDTAELAELRTRAETYGAKVAVRITNTLVHQGVVMASDAI